MITEILARERVEGGHKLPKFAWSINAPLWKNSSNLIGQKRNFVKILWRILLLWTHECNIFFIRNYDKMFERKKHVSKTVHQNFPEKDKTRHVGTNLRSLQNVSLAPAIIFCLMYGFFLGNIHTYVIENVIG
jgi:hypothetical protein